MAIKRGKGGGTRHMINPPKKKLKKKKSANDELHSILHECIHTINLIHFVF